MKAQFIGLKHISGTSTRTGKDYAFNTACIVTPMSERDVQKNAVGQDVHNPVIPDCYANVLCEQNVGKDIEINFVYANGREIIGYCTLAGK